MTSANDLTLRVGFDIDKFVKELGKTNATLNGWSNGMAGAIKGLAASFSALAIGRFVLDVSRLAGEAQGVKAAFDRLPESVKLMQDLKVATNGTVSELELMKRSVMASNFDISLKGLPKLLEFATLRARQTGQSVNYLVDSIVTGIGRKSKLILDNLGISAVALTEALGGASAASSTIGQVTEAVAKIISKELPKMGGHTDDAATKADRLAASWENLKVTIGTIANDAGVAKSFQVLDESLKRWGVILSGRAGKINDMRDLKMMMEVFNMVGKSKGPEKYFEMLNQLEEGAKHLNVQLIKLTDEVTGQQKIFLKNNVVKYVEGVKDAAVTVGSLEKQIQGLNEEISLSGSKSQIAKYQREIEGLQITLNNLLGKGTKAAPGIDVGQGILDEYFKNIKIFEDSMKSIKSADDEKDFWGEIMLPDPEEVKGFEDFSEMYFEKTNQMAQTAAAVGDAIGQGFGAAISGTQSFAQSMAQMAGSVVASLERMALAYMIENNAKYGLPGIAMAAVGFGLVKALFSKIGGRGGSGGGGSVQSGGGPTRRSYDAFHVQVAFTGEAGKMFKAIGRNQDRADGRSRS